MGSHGRIYQKGRGCNGRYRISTATRDVGLILASQKVEHYEISTHGGLGQLAKTLGYQDAATIPENILNEENQADELLTAITENHINYEAVHDREAKWHV